MPVHLSGRHGRIETSLDGIRFIRSKSDAARRETERIQHVGWDDVTGATVHTSRKGRPIVRVAVSGAPAPSHHRNDPHALKVPRKMSATALQLVEHINTEVQIRRRWRAHAQRTA